MLHIDRDAPFSGHENEGRSVVIESLKFNAPSLFYFSYLVLFHSVIFESRVFFSSSQYGGLV